MPHVTPSPFQSVTERRLRDELLADEDLQRAVRRVEELQGGLGTVARRRRLAEAFRLTRSTAPSVMEALAACEETLGHDGPVEVFVHPEPVIRATAVYGPPETPAIVLSARLLEVFTDAELRFVLGHELGHLAFEHFAFPLPATAMASDASGRILRRSVALGLYVWSRAAEVSADRAGLLCARDAEAAASALFKLTTGLSSAPVKSELQTHERQVDALLSEPSAREKPREDDDTLGCFNTQAFGPMRLRALAAFSRTRTFLRIAGRYASDEGRSDDEADTLLERDLRELVSAYPDQRELGDALARVRQEATLSERARLVQHLTLVAAPDGNVDDTGFLELRRMAEALSVPAWLVDEALRGAAHPLD